MRLKINEVDITRITENEAKDLQNEINKATGGNLFLTNDYPTLKKLYVLLNNSFNSSINGVHFFSKDKT